MLPLGVLFVLLTVGFWAYCLIDAIMTPPEELRSLTTLKWALLITVVPVIGAIAWLLAGRPDPSWRTAVMPEHLAGQPRLGQQADVWDYAATSPNPPIGPDDDPGFIRELERRLDGWRETGDDY